MKSRPRRSTHRSAIVVGMLMAIGGFLSPYRDFYFFALPQVGDYQLVVMRAVLSSVINFVIGFAASYMISVAIGGVSKLLKSHNAKR